MKIDKRYAILGGCFGIGALFALATRSSTKSAPTVKPASYGGPMPSTSNLSDQFFRDLHTLADTLAQRGASLSAEDIMSVFFSESGVNPASRNSLGFAGLNGMGSKERAALGFTGNIDEWCALPAEAQLPYVQKYIERDIAAFAANDFRVLDSPGKLYLLNFTPAYINKPRDFVIFKSPSDAYKVNRGIDVDNKGYIEVADLDLFLQKNLRAGAGRWAALQKRLADNAPGVV